MVNLESLDPNSEKMEEIYKTDNFISDIAFGASLFVFFDLNTWFPIVICNKFLYGPIFLFLNF